MPAPTSLPFTADAEANELLATDAFALLVGMLLDQQFPMEAAFRGPLTIRQRLGTIDPVTIAGTAEDTLIAAFAEKPAVHRFPAAMARRTHSLAVHIAESWDGDAASIWTTAADGHELYRRLRALPGFGEAKARIFVGVVGKRLDAAPPGWQEEAADWASIADVDDFARIGVIREAKRAAKADGKSNGKSNGKSSGKSNGKSSRKSTEKAS